MGAVSGCCYDDSYKPDKETESFEKALKRFYDHLYGLPLMGFIGMPLDREKQWLDIFARWLDNDLETKERILDWMKLKGQGR